MKRFCSLLIVGLCTSIGTAICPTRVTGGLIDFDGTGAPCPFALTSSLTERYAGEGVHFLGPGLHHGGAILNQCSNFNVSAHSGTDFLAFNRNVTLADGGIPQDPETIRFDIPQTDVSIWAAGGFSTDTFLMRGFDVYGNLVASDTVVTRIWARMTLSYAGGIDRVVLTQTGDQAFVYDDLAFSPEPTSLTLLLLACAPLLRRMRFGQTALPLPINSVEARPTNSRKPLF